NTLYSIKSLSKLFDTSEEGIKKNLSSLKFGDQLNFDMFGNDTFSVTHIAESFDDRQTDYTEKYWKKQTKKLIKIYKEQGYTPEQCSEISDVEYETVKKYWAGK
ncbi:TPA: hypothetical protein ND603_006119, partial [Klebsiella michiganensis]|nr:hypothetical protein [Klebsiella michiganensis]